MRERSTSLADRMGERFDRARLELQRGCFDQQPANRVVIHGVNPAGAFKGTTAAVAIAGTAAALVQSGRCYRLGRSVYFASEIDGHRVLDPIWDSGSMVSHAPATLSNLIVTSTGGDDPVESTPAPRFLAAVLGDEQLHRALPAMRYRSTRGCFDADFCVCQTGWNPESGIYVEGPALAPIPLGAIPTSDRYLDRLPPHLGRLLGEFAFRSDADAAAAVAMLLTGLLINHFIEVPHPAILIDGNQPSLGKSLLVQIAGRILDGLDPGPIALTGDEELMKRVGAQIDTRRSSVLYFDNLRGSVNSPWLEANILAPTVTARRLGHSTLIERPNGYLFCFTSNGMVGTPDLLSRSIVIRLHYEGDAARRRFEGKPLEYATTHRDAIHGELAGMVMRWLEGGRVEGEQLHRCDRWARLVGGVLRANGLDAPFLANLQEARAEMDEDLQQLGDLAAQALAQPPGSFWVEAGAGETGAGKTSGEWVPLFEGAGQLDRRAPQSQRSQATLAGKQLTKWANQGAEVVLRPEADGPAAGRCLKLLRREASGNRKLYYFDARPAAPPGSVDPRASDDGLQPAPSDGGPSAIVGEAGPVESLPEGADSAIAPGTESDQALTGTVQADEDEQDWLS